MVKLPGRPPPQGGKLTLLVGPTAPPTPLFPEVTTHKEPLASRVGDLRPLSASERTSVLLALREGAAASSGLPRRLSLLRIARRTYDVITEAVIIFEGGSALIEVAAETFPHVHGRLADLAPFLNVAAERLTHSGALPICLRDAGASTHLSFCDTAEDMLIPDSGFWSTGAYARERRWYAAAPAWEQRSTGVLWRGSTTGTPAWPWTELQRTKLCRIARDAPAELGFDVGFTSVVQLPEPAETEIQAEGLMRAWVPPSEYGAYQHHIDIDGNTNAWSGLFCKFLSGGLVFKVASPHRYRQWYYPRLQPWRHFVPVDGSLCDLEEKVRWAKAHPERAAEIAASGRQFAESLSLATEADFGIAVIEAALASLSHPLLDCPA